MTAVTLCPSFEAFNWLSRVDSSFEFLDHPMAVGLTFASTGVPFAVYKLSLLN